VLYHPEVGDYYTDYNEYILFASTLTRKLSPFLSLGGTINIYSYKDRYVWHSSGVTSYDVRKGASFHLGLLYKLQNGFTLGAYIYELWKNETFRSDDVEYMTLPYTNFALGVAYTQTELGLTIASDFIFVPSTGTVGFLMGGELDLGVFNIRGGVGTDGSTTIFSIGGGIDWGAVQIDAVMLSLYSMEFAFSRHPSPGQPRSAMKNPPKITELSLKGTVDSLTWTFITTASDLDDDIASYRWTFGDGTTGEGQRVEHRYAAPGTYRVCVEVIDSQGLSDKECKTITVQALPPRTNEPPQADFNWNPPLPQEGQPVRFTSTSTDPEGELIAFEWDFDDGTRESGTRPIVTHTFAQEGTYRVCLTVRDKGGLSDQTCKEIKVARAWQPPSNEKTRFFIPFISQDNNRQPTWSPDGRYIMFTSDRDGDWELYMLDLETQAITRITNSRGPDFDPYWCRGGKVAFVSDRDGQKGTDIYILDIATLGITRLTYDPDYLNTAPSCTPDGHAVIFTTNRDGDQEIYGIVPETRALTRITFSPVEDAHPQVSPDGSKIVFQSQVQGGGWEIFIMDIDGKNLRRLTFNPGDDIQPSWSPDGKWIAFASNRDGNFKIYVIDTEGKNERVLTQDNNNNLHPVWSPDGRKIAFESDRTRNWEIWVVDTDGRNLKRLTGVSR